MSIGSTPPAATGVGVAGAAGAGGLETPPAVFISPSGFPGAADAGPSSSSLPSFFSPCWVSLGASGLRNLAGTPRAATPTGPT
jgi:hypothetical protein